ncbi:MAG: NYN domain-containing protein [Magnetococcales bacterium]|nr:NYN domain-containing protein [Magnetococcales bacterium]
MRIRRIAILIDGGFFLKRLPKVVEPRFHDTPKAVAETARILCKRHVQRLIGETDDTDPSRWLDHVYRLFYYDARPFDGIAHHPIANRRIEYAKTSQAQFRDSLFQELRHKRKFALRLGKVTKEGDWQISSRLTKSLIKTREWVPLLESLLSSGNEGQALPLLTDEKRRNLEKLITTWKSFGEDDVSLILRQKGVDMRIGLDIASTTLKKQVDTIILVTGDSDFVPAAKMARREGVEFILDPMRQSVNDDLLEHIDGLISVFKTGNQNDQSEDNQ